MSFFSILLPLLQTALQSFLQYRLASDGRKIAIKSARAYVQGVEVARIVFFVLTGLVVLAIANIVAAFLVIHAAYLIYLGATETGQNSWVWFELCTGAFVLVVDLIILFVALNERLWMRIFKVPELMAAVLSESQVDRAA